MGRNLSFVECLHSKNIFWYFGPSTILHPKQSYKNLWMNKRNGIGNSFKNSTINVKVTPILCKWIICHWKQEEWCIYRAFLLKNNISFPMGSCCLTERNVEIQKHNIFFQQHKWEGLREKSQNVKISRCLLIIDE